MFQEFIAARMKQNNLLIFICLEEMLYQCFNSGHSVFDVSRTGDPKQEALNRVR